METFENMNKDLNLENFEKSLKYEKVRPRAKHSQKKQQLQAEIASRNCKQKLQAENVSKF